MSCGWLFVFYEQKTAYEISEWDWSSGVCSCDLVILYFFNCNLRLVVNFRCLLTSVAALCSSILTVRENNGKMPKNNSRVKLLI